MPFCYMWSANTNYQFFPFLYKMAIDLSAFEKDWKKGGWFYFCWIWKTWKKFHSGCKNIFLKSRLFSLWTPSGRPFVWRVCFQYVKSIKAHMCLYMIFPYLHQDLLFQPISCNFPHLSIFNTVEAISRRLFMH